MNEPVNILLIDDDEEDYIITRQLIDDISYRNYSLQWVDNYEHALLQFKKNKHDVYLVDYRIGLNTGVDIIREAQKKNISAPFILLTGIGSPELDEEALLAGASDYLIKGKISSSDLERSIRYAIEHSKNLAKIKELNQKLELRVMQRTRELESVVNTLELTNKTLENKIRENKQVQEELILALQKANELNELKSRFVSMASHEFRTPLTTILSSSTLMNKYFIKNEKESFEKHLKKIKSAVNNLTELLEYFLSAEKLEEGKVVPELVEFDMVELFNEHIHEVSDITKEGQKIIFRSNVPSYYVKFDKKISRTIIQNLLSNAIKYSGENSMIDVDLQIALHQLEFSVTDRGMGIPLEEQDFLFDRFYRARNAVNIQGTGLGLNIIKKYIELMNGKIWFKSFPEKGSTFFVSLPLALPH